MKMPNMANGRDGFPCVLNPVGDIFQRGTLPFETEASIDLGDASQEKKVLVGQIVDSATSSRLFRREMRFWLEMPKDLYQMNKLNCISEGYTGTGHLSICTKPVPTCTTYTQGEASSELVKAATYKAKGNSRSQSPFFLAGPLSLIFSSTKVTASDSPEVTVSMTSRESKTYGKCDSGSHLSSPESGSAKSYQRRSPIGGLRTDNLLNIKAESEFVQTTGKEKGPAVSQALLSTSMISGTGESNELHHQGKIVLFMN